MSLKVDARPCMRLRRSRLNAEMSEGSEGADIQLDGYLGEVSESQNMKISYLTLTVNDEFVCPGPGTSRCYGSFVSVSYFRFSF